jgi:hypothetical protein
MEGFQRRTLVPTIFLLSKFNNNLLLYHILWFYLEDRFREGDGSVSNKGVCKIKKIS